MVRNIPAHRVAFDRKLVDGRNAIVYVHYSGADTTRLEQLEIPPDGGLEGPLSAAQDDGVEKQVASVDEICSERKRRKLGAVFVM